MESQRIYAIAADVVLAAHALVVLFVVLGAVAIGVGGLAGWSWIRHRGFRVAHVVCIAVVVLQSWLGAICPLTTLEMTLRRRAGEPSYGESFVAHWLGRLVYHEAPAWVFVAAYTVFGAAVVACWRWVRPYPARRGGARRS
jgi:hypothetical protein